MGILKQNEISVMNMHNSGSTRTEISNKFGCTVGAVSAFLKNRGIKLNKVSYGILSENKDKIINMLDNGLSAYKISKELNVSDCSVLRFIKKHNLKNKNKCKVNYNNLLKDREQEVVDLYNSGKTCQEIADFLGYSQSQISILLKKTKLYVREWKYSVDEHFFDFIDNEEKAYVLGWFYSDGCVDNSGKIRIQIQKDDEEILYKIKELMKYDGPIYEVPPPKKFPHRKSQVCLNINRKTLADNLIKLGCVPNKSCILKCPSGEIMEEYLFRHFVRGVFDGDGSIGIRKGKYLTASLTGSIDMIEKICMYLDKVLNIHSHIYYKNKNDKFCQMWISTTDDTIVFCDWLYSDSNYYLKRKLNIFLDFLSIYGCQYDKIIHN